MRALDDRRQHDIHDADTADEQREHRHAADDDAEGALHAEALGEELARDDDLEVAAPAVPAGERLAERARDLFNPIRIRDLNPDFIDRLRRHDSERSARHRRERHDRHSAHLAEAKRRRRRATRRVAGRLAQHADHFDVALVDAHALADGLPVPEQLPCEARAQHAHLRRRHVVDRREHAALADREMEDVLEGGPHAEHAHHRRLARARDRKNAFDDRRHGADAGNEHRNLFRVARRHRSGGDAWCGRSLPARHDVVEPQRFDLRERVAAGAVADRHHRDDRGDAEHDAEHAQRRSQLVAAQRFRGDADRFSGAAHRGDRRRAAARSASLRRPRPGL